MKREALHTEKSVCQIEIPTIIIVQIQRLLGSEQRNNKFNHIRGKMQKEKIVCFPSPRAYRIYQGSLNLQKIVSIVVLRAFNSQLELTNELV